MGKGEKQAKEMSIMTLNAKSETVFEKPSFRLAIPKQRCLIPVNGFYEWREVNKKKYPYFITLKGREVFSLGGIYETWLNKSTGELVKTCSIITTEANPLMAKIHNVKKRMPLILPIETEQVWINEELNKDDIQGLMKPFDDRYMEAYTISKLITSRTENSNQPMVKEHFDYPELALTE